MTNPTASTPINPDELAATMRDKTISMYLRIDAAEKLQHHLEGGGRPQSMGYSLGGNTAAVLLAKQEVSDFLRFADRWAV